MDRIDLKVEAPKVEIKQLSSYGKSESSKAIKARVEKARERQLERFEGTHYRFNAELGVDDIKKYCPLGVQEQELIEQVFNVMKLSARVYHKIIKVARTIADLDDRDQITTDHISEAVSYRTTI